jgi:hypothetical protein
LVFFFIEQATGSDELHLMKQSQTKYYKINYRFFVAPVPLRRAFTNLAKKGYYNGSQHRGTSIGSSSNVGATLLENLLIVIPTQLYTWLQE